MAFPTLESSRLILREITDADASDLFDFFSDAEVMRYYDGAPMTDLSQASKLIERFRHWLAQGSGIRWGITLRESNTIIGTCGIFARNKAYFSATLGYELSKKYWRQGYMTEAVTQILGYGFSELNINRIEAMTDPNNVASIRSLKKLGFSEEGLLRQNGFWNGKFHDSRCFSMLKEEWLASAFSDEKLKHNG